MEENGLFDLDCKGYKYTWSNRHKDNSLTKERLDRALVNLEWREMIGTKEMEVLTLGRFDHKPLLMCTQEELLSIRKKRKIFIFEVQCIKDQEGAQILINAVKKEEKLHLGEVI